MKRFWLKIKGLFPRQLPIGRQHFEKFFSDLCLAYNIPTNVSYKHALAGMIMHLKPTESKRSMRWFSKCIRKAQANEVAYAVIEEIREAEKNEQKRLEALKADTAKKVQKDNDAGIPGTAPVIPINK